MNVAVWFRELAQDVRHAGRRLFRNPWFTIVAVSYFAVGVAANTSMFSVFNALALRALPFDRPDELATVAERDRISGQRASPSYADYLEWRGVREFVTLAAHAGRVVAITQDDAERVSARLVSANFLPMLGIAPQVGRGLTPADDAVGAPPVALISDGLWRRRYGGDSSVQGRSITLNGRPYTIVGVMPRGFRYPGSAELWLPIGAELGALPRTTRGVSVMGRLAADAPRAASAVTAIAQRLHALDLAQAGGQRREWIGDVRGLRGSVAGSDERLVAAAMLGATTILLLIACSNVANLLLIRAVTRQREIAVRAALGASQGRIARELAAEAMGIAALGCLAALPLTWEALRLIAAAIPESDAFPYYVRWSLDAPTFTYAALVSLGTGALFGLAPVVAASRGRLFDALKVGGSGSGSAPRQQRVRSALVVLQVALALVLLVGASLFVRTFVSLNNMRLGYDPAHVMTMRFNLPGARYDSLAPRLQVIAELVRAVRALPGVTAATICDLIPLDDTGGSQSDVETDGGSDDLGRRSTAYGGVTGDWFATLGVVPLEGRLFQERELGAGAPPLAVVNRAMARRFWPDGSALGRRFRFMRDSTRTWFTVIGVVPDIRTVKLDESQSTPPTAWVPLPFVSPRDLGLMVRTTGAPASIMPSVRGAVRGVDPTIPLFNIWTMGEVKYLSFWMYGMWSTMFGAFGAIALGLAAVGVYAVIFYSVTQRTREIGVRVALGARRRDIVGLVLSQGVALAGGGVLLGLAGALALTRVVESLLIGISPTDPVSFVAVVVGLLIVAALAAWFPARRASGVDPLTALRHE